MKPASIGDAAAAPVVATKRRRVISLRFPTGPSLDSSHGALPDALRIGQ
jgi:hypothetical protein